MLFLLNETRNNELHKNKSDADAIEIIMNLADSLDFGVLWLSYLLPSSHKALYIVLYVLHKYLFSPPPSHVIFIQSVKVYAKRKVFLVLHMEVSQMSKQSDCIDGSRIICLLSLKKQLLNFAMDQSIINIRRKLLQGKI